ncbi:MAG: sugar kinase [Armatimonadetes bacterium]|nr:sugar kinase [Armatimonadota bacterium]
MPAPEEFTTAMHPDIVTVGECMVEVYQAEGSGALLECSVGGDTLNVAVAAARLGATCGFITRVGDDLFGPLLLGRWSAEGIDLSQTRIVPGFNGVYYITLAPGGERSFTYYRRGSAASTLEPSDLDASYIGSATIAHTSGITQAISPSARAAVRHLAEIAKKYGVKFSFDTNFRPKLWTAAEARAELRWLLSYIDILLPSAGEEGEALWGTPDPQRIARLCVDAGVGVVAVKSGQEGCWVGSACVGPIHVPAVTGFRVVDTTGAGDAFDGAFLFALLRGADIYDAARLAVLVGAISCGGRGALGSLPNRATAAAEWIRVYGEPSPGWL